MKDLYGPLIIFSIPTIVFAVLIYRAISSIHLRIIYPYKQRRKRTNEHGYILTENGQFEHRAIVEDLIKRHLREGEEVHHINGIKWDNRKSNLALMTRSEHLRWHKKLEWMWSKKYRTTIRWQREQLVENFGAVVF